MACPHNALNESYLQRGADSCHYWLDRSTRIGANYARDQRRNYIACVLLSMPMAFNTVQFFRSHQLILIHDTSNDSVGLHWASDD